MFVYVFIAGLFIVSLILAYYFASAQNIVSTPGGLRVDEIRSNDMADLITYRVSAGTPVSSDVVSRLVTVVVDDVTQGSTSYGASVSDFGNITVPQDSSVTVTLVDVDDAGNKSDPAAISFVAADTIPPAQPGFLGVTLVGETHVEDPVVEVPTEPEASTEPEVTPESDETVG
jgi:hypothetical protein